MNGHPDKLQFLNTSTDYRYSNLDEIVSRFFVQYEIVHPIVSYLNILTCLFIRYSFTIRIKSGYMTNILLVACCYFSFGLVSRSSRNSCEG